jgi:hypothetical protein
MNARRHKLLWIGGEPGSTCSAACEGRDLELEVLTGCPTLLHLQQGRGLIIAVDDGSVASVLGDSTGSWLREAVSHGLSAFVSCSFADATAVAEALKSWRISSCVEICLRGDEDRPIEQIARVKHEPPINDGLRVHGGVRLTPEETILLKRAFGDCSSVRLVKQPTGSAKVFCAFASLLNSRVGPIPLPFFVKFDDSKNIDRELDNYRQCTALHVPFNQRPNLDPDRCLISHSTGVIVGNFVEQSESLLEVIDRGAGRDALHSLFEGALRGWRRQAFYDDARYVTEGNILRHLRRSCPSSYNPKRKCRLGKRQQAVGSDTCGFEELEAMLEALPPTRYRYGMTHGDLHGNNVRVAGSDAILIDFASVDEGPLTVDPAALDVSLMMDTRLAQGDDWIRLADEIYGPTALRAPAIPPRPELPAADLLDALHYIRQTAFAVQFSAVEYPLVVALQLLRKSSYKGDDEEQERRRIHAFRLADRITKSIANASSMPTGRSAA